MPYITLSDSNTTPAEAVEMRRELLADAAYWQDGSPGYAATLRLQAKRIQGALIEHGRTARSQHRADARANP